MSWKLITETEFLEQCTGAETKAIQEAALKAGQAEPLTAMIAKVVQEVRARVAANPENRLDDGRDKIPQECEADAIAIMRYRALNRLPVKSLLTETRIQEYKDARDNLKDVAAGRIKIEQPATVSDQIIPSGSGAVLISKTCPRATRSKMSGL